MHYAMNILVSCATIHLKKIAAKSQDLGKQISCKRVPQQILRQRNKRFAFAFCGVLLVPGITLMEVRRVDLRSKLNVLAVCAVFVFVGAILLGAF